MPLEAPVPGSAEDWLRHAEADLALARVPLPKGGLYELLCYHAQQAAEKSIKAVLVERGVPFPRTHALERLVDLLPGDIPRTPQLESAARLTVYATETRYPGASEPVSESEYREAVRVADAVVHWAGATLGRPRLSG